MPKASFNRPYSHKKESDDFSPLEVFVWCGRCVLNEIFAIHNQSGHGDGVFAIRIGHQRRWAIEG